ncbi:MAG: polyribonucleotide nucleotidyltransferase, partial [Spirochaetales bacterium]|nr:polyribonucleotide nucleotidyltransferase [Spirochaetales bacterium]
MSHQVRLKIGEEDLILETGKIARQANGSVFGRYAGSAVLAAACCSGQDLENLSFIPLSVEYNEKYYAAGKIPGGFIKREGRPKDKEILISRLIDRPLRPLFSKKFKREIQVVPTVVSTDQINPPDVIAMVAASAAVTISDIPFAGPVGAVRIGYLDGSFIINPTYDQIGQSLLDIVVAGTEEGITMVEGSASEVSEEIMVQAIEEAHKWIKELCRIQVELAKAAGKEKIEVSEESEDVLDPAVQEEFLKWAKPKMEEACFVLGKMNRSSAIKEIQREAREKYAEKIPEEQLGKVNELLEDLEYTIVRSSILERKVRTDGRSPTDIRQVTCEIDVLSRTHGSALFTRGETQSLAVTTLGTVFDEQILDNIEGDSRKAFMLHYNFPPFSVGETGRLGANRRAIGHGYLAERSLLAVIPGKDEFPYTIRLVSEILESNGSSSMATVCGGILSLLNAGVPLRKSVAGIAMGLIKEDQKYVVLSDILGEEDHLG